MKLLILSPEKKVFEGAVEQVSVPGTLGPFQILKGHAPLISTLRPGVLCCIEPKRRWSWTIASGVVEVQREDQITVILHQLPTPIS